MEETPERVDQRTATSDLNCRHSQASPAAGGSNLCENGVYVSGYGFGGQTVPLNLSAWVRSVARARGWKPVNL